MSESNYCVYKHTSPSGKSYIGQTKNLKKRSRDHQHNSSGCTLFLKAIKKYGWDNFNHEILKDNLTLDEANYWEEFYIDSHNTLSPHGYNLKNGGLNMTCSEETRKKMSVARKGTVCSQETKLKMSISFSGRNHSIETKNKMSESRKGFKHSEETKLKMSARRTGMARNESSKIKMSESMKKVHALKKQIPIKQQTRSIFELLI